MLIIIFTSYIIVSMIIRVLDKSQFETTKNTSYKNFISENEDHYLNTSNIKVALRWEDVNGDVIPSDIGYIEAYNHRYWNYSRSAARIGVEWTKLELEECNEYNFSPDPKVMNNLQNYL